MQGRKRDYDGLRELIKITLNLRVELPLKNYSSIGFFPSS